MREADAFRLGSSAGGKDDFHEVVRVDRKRCIRFIRMSSDDVFKIIQRYARNIESRLCVVGEQQFSGDLLLYSRGEAGCRLEIEWDDDCAAQQAAIKSRDPLRAVLTPKKHAIAAPNATRFRLAGKLKSARCEASIGPARDPESAPVGYSG